MCVPFLLLALLSGACGSAARYRAFDSANAVERARAAINAGQTRDYEAIPKLVDLLEDQDPAVRMYAIQSLRRLCDEDFGYRHYRPEGERMVAVQRWRAALRAGTLKPAPAATQPAERPTIASGAPAASAGAGVRETGLGPGQ